MYFPSFLRRRIRARRRRQSAQEGQTLVEYSLILALVALVSISAFTSLGNHVVAIFSEITSLLDTAQAP